MLEVMVCRIKHGMVSAAALTAVEYSQDILMRNNNCLDPAIHDKGMYKELA
jgi:hypothetical protein